MSDDHTTWTIATVLAVATAATAARRAATAARGRRRGRRGGAARIVGTLVVGIRDEYAMVGVREVGVTRNFDLSAVGVRY